MPFAEIRLTTKVLLSISKIALKISKLMAFFLFLQKIKQ